MSTMMSRSDTARGGFLFVAAGAALWGTDAVFRRGLALDLPAATLVFAEHAVLVLVTAPLLWRHRAHLRNLGSVDWLAAVIIGAGSSALATILFTSAFRYGDPTTPLLLQKVQPLIAVAAARLLLGERLLPRYAWFLAAGLSGAYLVAFPDPTAVSVAALTPALLAVGAAALWGLGTVLGRRLAPKLPFAVLTSLRFAIGLPAAGLLMSLGSSNSAGPLVRWVDIPGVVALALIPGLLALLLYYRGLRTTPAAAATIAELAFPLTAAGLNYFVFGTVLTVSQWFGVSCLAGTIGVMSWLSRVGHEESLGVRSESLSDV
jgi:drug/metabolite transporter (DMT)-like permease